MQETQQYSLEQTSKVIADYLGNTIKEYFPLFINENSLPVHEIIDAWLFDNGMDNEITLDRVIMYILDQYAAIPEKEACLQVKSLKKNRKDYFYRTIRQETGELKPTPNNPKFIETEWAKLNDPYIRSSKNAEITLGSKEEFFETRKEQIRTWFKNPESYLFEFLYFNTLPAKRRVNSFLQDLSVDVYTLICNDFYRNKFGFMTKSPDLNFGITDLPIVNWQSSTPKLQFEAADNRIKVFEVLKEENDSTVRIIVDEVAADCSTEDKKETAILKLEEEYNAGTRVKTLDTKDLAIYSVIFNDMTIESATSDALKVTLPDLAGDLYGHDAQLTKKMYSDLLNRLNKLAHMRISSTVQDENGNLLSDSVISFFDIVISINSDPDKAGNRKTLKTIKVSENSSLRDFSNLGIHEFINTDITIMPSFYTKDMWKNNVHNQISTHLYKKITSSRGKMVSQLLQEERMRIYPDTHTTISIKYFKDKIRVTSRNNDRIKKEIAAEMTELLDAHIQIADFHFNRNTIDIDFLPLTKEEKLFYKV